VFNDLSLNNDIFLLRSGLIPSVMVVIGQCFPNRTFLYTSDNGITRNVILYLPYLVAHCFVSHAAAFAVRS
jgi:hypothetical protein